MRTPPCSILGAAGAVFFLLVFYSAVFCSNNVKIINPSRFLNASEFEITSANKTLSCNFKELTHQTYQARVLSYQMTDVIRLLQDANLSDYSHTKDSFNIKAMELSQRHSLRVMLERHYPFFEWVDQANDTYIILDTASREMTPSQLLCAEVFLLTNEADVFLPLYTTTEETLGRKYDQYYYERHFSLPIIMPDASTVTLLTDKGNFADFMTANTMARFIPV